MAILRLIGFAILSHLLGLVVTTVGQKQYRSVDMDPYRDIDYAVDGWFLHSNIMLVIIMVLVKVIEGNTIATGIGNAIGYLIFIVIVQAIIRKIKILKELIWMMIRHFGLL